MKRVFVPALRGPNDVLLEEPDDRLYTAPAEAGGAERATISAVSVAHSDHGSAPSQARSGTSGLGPDGQPWTPQA